MSIHLDDKTLQLYIEKSLEKADIVQVEAHLDECHECYSMYMGLLKFLYENREKPSSEFIKKVMGHRAVAPPLSIPQILKLSIEKGLIVLRNSLDELLPVLPIQKERRALSGSSVPDSAVPIQLDGLYLQLHISNPSTDQYQFSFSSLEATNAIISITCSTEAGVELETIRLNDENRFSSSFTNETYLFSISLDGRSAGQFIIQVNS